MTTAVVLHHHRVRYSAAGKVRVKKASRSDQVEVRAPAEATRARASTEDRYGDDRGSGLADRTTDRCVETRW